MIRLDGADFEQPAKVNPELAAEMAKKGITVLTADGMDAQQVPRRRTPSSEFHHVVTDRGVMTDTAQGTAGDRPPTRC